MKSSVHGGNVKLSITMNEVQFQVNKGQQEDDN